MRLYRAVSVNERQYYKKYQKFSTAKNTLEAKQFFKFKAGVLEFIRDSVMRNFHPSYKYLFLVEIDEECLSKIEYDEQILDGHVAITIQELHLQAFNNCVNLVVENVIQSDI